MAGVRLEFDPLLEVHQVKLHFLGAVIEREVADQRVQEGRFARAGLAGDEDVLGRPLAKPQMLPLGGADAAQGHANARFAIARPPLFGRRGHELKRHLDALGLKRSGAHNPEDVGAQRIRRRTVELQVKILEVIVLPDETPVLPFQLDAGLLQVLDIEARRQRLLGIDGNERVHAAARAAVDDADQAPGRLIGEVEWKVRDDQNPIRLGDLSGMRVVFLDRLKLIAQVFLDDVFHVAGQVGQTLIDLGRLGPDTAGNQGLVVIGQVHERGEIAPEPDRIDDGEAHLPRRQGGQ